MKKRISLSVDESTADLLEQLSQLSEPHLSKSAIGEYAIQTVDMSKFIEGEKNEARNKKSR